MKDNLHETILLEGLAKGNVKIFDYLFHFYYSGLVVFAMKYVADKDIAEDIVQEFFYKLWLNKDKLVIDQTIKSYFFTSIKNRSLDYLRHLKVKDKVSQTILQSYDDKLDIEYDYIVESELQEKIEHAIQNLPEKCRHIFIMNRLEGLKPVEIAEKENISKRTVEGHIGKALKILREELEPHLPTYLILLLLKSLN